MVGVSTGGRQKLSHWRGGSKRPWERQKLSYKWSITIVVFISTFVSFVAIKLDIVPQAVSDSRRKHPKCRYHGNCPVGEVCQNGLCDSYRNASKSLFDQGRHDLCLESCLNELKVDEWYYHGSVPIVQGRKSSENGCILMYQRKRKEKVSTEQWTPPSFEEWLQQRFRRVIRTDPVSQKKLGSDVLVWNALCAFPCESNQDCPNELKCEGRPASQTPPGILSSPKTCRHSDNGKFSNDMMIISGSDIGYFDALENFAASLQFWSPRSRLVVYNLGMSDEQIGRVEKWPNVHRIHWKDGIPRSYPPHVQDLKNYAWKSIAVNESVHEYKSIFWLDAGATFTGPLDPIQDILHRDGIFLVKGQDASMKQLSHPSTYKWFGFDKETFVGGPHFAGGIQGHVYPSRFISTIVVPNAGKQQQLVRELHRFSFVSVLNDVPECALDPNCISPEGSSLSDHRYDQTSLSILAYQNHVRPQHHTEYLAAGRHQLNDNMKEPNRFIMWTARGSCQYYSELKNLLDPE
jgi:hypothetical protein